MQAPSFADFGGEGGGGFGDDMMAGFDPREMLNNADVMGLSAEDRAAAEELARMQESDPEMFAMMMRNFQEGDGGGPMGGMMGGPMGGMMGGPMGGMSALPPSAQPRPVAASCALCKKSSSDTKLSRCSRCKVVWYCSSSCQVRRCVCVLCV